MSVAKYERMREARGHEETETPTQIDTRIARDISTGKRCGRCHLLAPCGGHETLAAQFHAERRRPTDWTTVATAIGE